MKRTGESGGTTHDIYSVSKLYPNLCPTPSIAQTQLPGPPAFDTITPFSLAAMKDSSTTTLPSEGVSSIDRGEE